jgi:hypothetical protein
MVIAAHALPRALDGVIRPAGTVAAFSAEGEGGGTWHVVSASADWELEPASPAGPVACHVRTTVDDALRLYVREPGALTLNCEGDRELAEALFGVKAILG